MFNLIYFTRRQRTLPFWCCAALLLVSGACKPSGEKGVQALRRLNVVLVTIDTLRADRLGCYGYSGAETPNLDRLAGKGVLFENAVAQSPLTPPSHASIMTGLNPTVHQVRNTGGFILHSRHTTLAEILQQQGWDTAAFIGASVLKRNFGLDQGFPVYDDRMPKPEADAMVTEYPERRAGEVVDRAITWLDARTGNPFFLWVHVFDPHAPYDPPPPFREKYKGRPYDGEVAYTDQQLGRLFDAVERKFPSENTLTAVLSDHGESLSEHGEFTHGVFLYDSTLRVAFAMAGPGVPKGLRVKQQVRTIDLLPTLIDLMGGKAAGEAQGSSLTPAFAGKQTGTEYSYAETLFPKINMGWAELRCLRTNRWKYIRAPKPELYDLVRDPEESTNVIGAHPAEANALEAKLKEITGSAGGSEKVETQLVNQRTMEQLRSLGYTGGAPRREYELTGKGIDPKDRLEILRLLHLAVAPDSGLPAARRIELLRKAAAADPSNPSVYYHLGDEYGKLGRSEAAMKLYQDALSKGIETSWLYSRIAYLYLRQGKTDRAIASYEKAVEMNPSDIESLNDMAMAYLETGRLADAERAFNWILKTGEDYAPAHNGLGLVAIQRQDAAAARGHFERAVEVDPAFLEAQLNLGRIYLRIGANARARACFEAFLARASQKEWGAVIPKVKAELAAMQ